jgi:Protein of unknown function (DUF2846)
MKTNISIMNILNRKALFCLAVSAILLSGCATSTKATVENDISAKSFTPNETKSIVYLYRPGKAFAGAVLAPIQINGGDAGAMGPGGFFKWELEPNTYTFSTIIEGSSAVVKLDAKAGQLYFLKMDYNFNVIHGAKCNLDIVDDSEGKKGVERTNLLISTLK